jgi:hypothetical protein
MARPQKGSGRITAKGTHRQGDTPPAGHGRHAPRPSPRWFGAAIGVALALGVATIFLNYLGALFPGAPSNFWLMVGLAFLLIGIVAATQYR